jgi:hypothetical protein
MGAHDQDVAHVQSQLTEGSALVPQHLWRGIINHVIDGSPTGDFLSSLFDNDLLNAVCRADETTLAGLRNLMLFMHNYAPQRCWGSPELAQRWRDAGGIRGGAHLLREEPR